jgi:hypothetical protein
MEDDARAGLQNREGCRACLGHPRKFGTSADQDILAYKKSKLTT